MLAEDPTDTAPFESKRIRSVAFEWRIKASISWSYWTCPLNSSVPEVLSEKKILPLLLVPLRIVIPVSPEVAIVKSSAVPNPSVVVPIITLPDESTLSFSLPPPSANRKIYLPEELPPAVIFTP